jgi:hypothetical protein
MLFIRYGKRGKQDNFLREKTEVVARRIQYIRDVRKVSLKLTLFGSVFLSYFLLQFIGCFYVSSTNQNANEYLHNYYNDIRML